MDIDESELLDEVFGVSFFSPFLSSCIPRQSFDPKVSFSKDKYCISTWNFYPDQDL